MKLKQYLKYKDSGVQWVGEIPEEWKTNKLKHNFLALSKSSLEASEGNDEGKFPFFTSSKTQDKYIDKAIFDDDCLVLGTGGVACVHHVKGQFSVSTDCLTLKKEKKDNSMKFLYYQVLSEIDVIDDLGFWGMGLRHLQKYFFHNMFSYIPQLEEQNSIVNFLDSKTSQLDQTIEKDKQLIELLKEKRIALINQVVTKGLDKDVKMKYSGIDWIGEIPENWNDLFKIKHFCSTTKGLAFKSELFGLEGVRVVKATDIKNETILEGEDYISIEDSKYFSNVKLHEKDIILSTVGSTPDVKESAVGQFGIVPKGLDNSLLNQNTVRLELKKQNKMHYEYFTYLLRSDSFRKYLDINAHGTANQASLNVWDILEFRFFLPSKVEQEKIAFYLDKETLKIDQIIKKIEEKITLMEEYKKSLIHHVVTGKVDVREAVA
ncbi:hypothetical protein COU58_02570 [Candidatus Pacearchaeota archaeon CG10_big_fil_rev_8_21_14_0_10_32_42]|nr:MAG: hypothetical protein COU58_02570 [Candidatus Pacearchaeota archaeon CG10_big_fil_rev_8_21_14_0_10_32_42]